MTGLFPESFDSPVRLWLLVGVFGLVVLYLIMQFRRRAYAVRFTNVDLLDSVAPQRPGWRRHVPAGLFLIGLASVIVAFAEPTRATEVPRERATIIMAIDTSLSMEAADVEPSRIDGAKEAASAFLDVLPERLNVGLVSFNGVATVRVPPTTDRQAVKNAVAALELDEATAIGEAIYASLDAIEAVLPDEDGSVAPARIVLMSDGETTVGRPDAQAVEAAQLAQVPISTIAFGTDRGVIELPGEDFPIAVPVNEEALAAIADGSGGQFFTAATTSELAAVYEDIGSSVGFETEQTDIGDRWMGIAAVLLTLTAAFSLLWFSRIP